MLFLLFTVLCACIWLSACDNIANDRWIPLEDNVTNKLDYKKFNLRSEEVEWEKINQKLVKDLANRKQEINQEINQDINQKVNQE